MSPSRAIRPRAAVSLGVGENDSKRIGGDFEAQLIRALGEKYRTIWIDRGVGGEEARRVTAAAEASGCMRPHPLLGRLVRRIRFPHRAMRFLRRIRFRRAARRRRRRRSADLDFRGRPVRAFPPALEPGGAGTNPGDRRRFDDAGRVSGAVSQYWAGLKSRDRILADHFSRGNDRRGGRYVPQRMAN